MRWFRRKLEAPLIGGVIAGLVFQALLLSWHAPAMALAQGFATGALQSVILCTGDGARRLVLDADGKPADDPAPSDFAKLCPICQALGGTATPVLASDPSGSHRALGDSTAYAPEACDSCGIGPGIARGHDPPAFA